MPDFWKSAGLHLVEIDDRGWLTVTPDYLRAYLTRPEVHPIDTSCAEEVALFEDLMADPFQAVEPERLNRIADADAEENYGFLLRFRDTLVAAGTLEEGYLRLMRGGRADLPPVFIDQMVHLILRNILKDCRDPIRIKAAEILFREQTVSTDGGRIMLADEEIVEMYSQSGGAGGLGRLLVANETPMRRIEMDVLGEDNKHIYWERSDRFDTVIDLRFTEPALDGLARVIEAWIRHFTSINVRVQPRRDIKDERWSWHIGLDRESTRILNALYKGEAVGLADLERLIALFRMDMEEGALVIDGMGGKPVYLGLAAGPGNRLKMKPQNLLTNLPLRPGA